MDSNGTRINDVLRDRLSEFSSIFSSMWDIAMGKFNTMSDEEYAAIFHVDVVMCCIDCRKNVCDDIVYDHFFINYWTKILVHDHMLANYDPNDVDYDSDCDPDDMSDVSMALPETLDVITCYLRFYGTSDYAKTFLEFLSGRSPLSHSRKGGVVKCGVEMRGYRLDHRASTMVSKS